MYPSALMITAMEPFSGSTAVVVDDPVLMDGVIEGTKQMTGSRVQADQPNQSPMKSELVVFRHQVLGFSDLWPNAAAESAARLGRPCVTSRI